MDSYRTVTYLSDYMEGVVSFPDVVRIAQVEEDKAADYESSSVLVYSCDSVEFVQLLILKEHTQEYFLSCIKSCKSIYWKRNGLLLEVKVIALYAKTDIDNRAPDAYNYKY